MAEGTKVEWTATRIGDRVIPGHTFNIVWGCQRVSPGCTNCYAETWAKRHGHDVWGPAKTTPRRVLSDDYWAQPLKWAKRARQLGIRQKVFCSSMADVFEDHPTVDEQRERLWPLIEQTEDGLDWLLLTKRPENVICHPSGPMVPNDWLYDHVGFPPNVWIGASAENQEWYDKRLPHLNRIPASVTFWSMEPLVGPIVMSEADRAVWVIVGGESGHGARPMRPQWVQSLRDQCKAERKAFFFKQWGEELPKGQGAHGLDERGLFRRESHIGGQTYYRVGKAAAGRHLDGRTWDEVPA